MCTYSYSKWFIGNTIEQTTRFLIHRYAQQPKSSDHHDGIDRFGDKPWEKLTAHVWQ